MNFSDLKVGDKFRFDFESDGPWVYIKDDEEYFTEVHRPKCCGDCKSLTFSIKDMESKKVEPYYTDEKNE